MAIQDLIDELIAFRDAREWEQFHTPRNLAAALAIEAAELQEEMLWKSDREVAELVGSSSGRERVSEEIADVMIYALLFCEAVGVEPISAVRAKLQKNAAKYPVEKSKGRSAKYTELEA